MGGWRNGKVKFSLKLFYDIQKGKNKINMFSEYMVEHLYFLLVPEWEIVIFIYFSAIMSAK